VTREELQARYPNASEGFLRRNADPGDSGVRATYPKRTELLPLDSKASGKTKGGGRVVQRDKVTYRIFAIRPADWDNNSIKGLHDLLVTAGFLRGDAWYQLEGSIVSEKVHSKEEEKTVVEITPCR